MDERIASYLESLRQALAGVDPALMQDALYDAEEHLRSEMEQMPEAEREKALPALLERFGEPEEVARAYREAEIRLHGPSPAAGERTPTTPSGRPRQDYGLGPFFGVLVDPHAYGALFYMLLSLITGILYFTWVVTGASISVSFLILIIGIPILLLFLATTRVFSFVEGRIVEALLGVRMPRRHRPAGTEGQWLERIKEWFTDARTWATMLYMLVMMPLGIFYFTLAVTWLGVSLGLFAAPWVQLIAGEPIIQFGWGTYWLEWWAFPLLMAVGALLAVIGLHLFRLIGRAHGTFAKAMLVSRI
ncbi:MAG: sensor domain-containing protein [bacterium]